MVEKRFDVTTLGEILLRLSVPAGRRLEDAANFDVFPAGAEANVVIGLGHLGRRCAFAGALPRGPLGRLATSGLRLAGVDLDGVVFRDEGRIGAYYVELAEAPRGVRVVYDRADSCAARMRPQEIPWERILDSRLLHLTGITPALSSSCRAITKAALSRAREAGVSVSFDVNHRRKLWTEDEAARTLEPMMRGAEILFCSARDARLLFSLGGDPDEVAARLQQRTGARRVVVSCGEEGAAARDGSEAFREPGRKVRVLDRLGAGDALAAGVIHGYLGGDFRQGLRYGVALSALALTQSGDAVVTTPEELRSIADRSSEENFR